MGTEWTKLPPNANCEVSQLNTYSEFKGTVDFRNCLFEEDVNFSGATFSAMADFGGAKFIGTAWFSGAKFDSEVDFGFAKFDSADFRRVTCKGQADFGATFDGEADFNWAKFEGNAFFIGLVTSQRDASFRTAKFGGKAWFRLSKFGGDVNFSEAKFDDDADFGGAKFTGDALFRDATFSKDTLFEDVTFKRLDLTKTKYKRLFLRWETISKALFEKSEDDKRKPEEDKRLEVTRTKFIRETISRLIPPYRVPEFTIILLIYY